MKKTTRHGSLYTFSAMFKNIMVRIVKRHQYRRDNGKESYTTIQDKFCRGLKDPSESILCFDRHSHGN
jgi:hypothetical protein